MTALHKAAREALIAWWEDHRPLGWTAEQHRAQPTVNAQRETDKPLMEIAAALSEAPGEEREGWVLVPVEPTQAMMDAMQSGAWMPGNYRAMLAARPDPERAAARQRVVGPSLPELVDQLRDAVPEVAGQVAARPELWAVMFKDGIPVNVSLARTQKSAIRLTCMRFGETWKSLKARGMRCARVTVEVVPDETK